MGSTRSPRLWIGIGCVVLAAIAFLIWVSRSTGAGTTPKASQTEGSLPRSRATGRRSAIDERSPAVPGVAPGAAPSAAIAAVRKLELLRDDRLARAELTLESYLQSAQYPPFSRPMSEAPDLVRPHHVDTTKLPLARPDRKLTDAKITLHQDRFLLVGDERVTLSIACETSAGPALCEVLTASARVPPDMAHPSARSPIPVLFADQGREGDKVAGDGALAAQLQPSTQGFTDYHGPIRVDLEVRVAAESGGASFEFEYTPSSPAKFTGAIREILEDGSLDLYIGMQILRPGRYVIRARVDDAEDRQFAFLTWNEPMDVGAREAKLHLFGKLVRDEGAKAPFRLRDVEGFLLLEDIYPDREALLALEGIVHTTKRYVDADFSTEAWQSEEKTRHTGVLTENIERARRESE
jgi:hypothetical protein